MRYLESQRVDAARRHVKRILDYDYDYEHEHENPLRLTLSRSRLAPLQPKRCLPATALQMGNLRMA